MSSEIPDSISNPSGKGSDAKPAAPLVTSDVGSATYSAAPVTSNAVPLDETKLALSQSDPPTTELKSLQEIIQLLKEPRKESPKDNWDRFAAMSTFVSSVVIALIGLYFTHSYNNAEANRRDLQEARQNQINELDVIAKFMPYLTGQDENAKVTAITTIKALAGVRLAAVMAELHPSAGTALGLEVIAQSSVNTQEDRTLAESSANKIYDTLSGINVFYATDRKMIPGTVTRYDTTRGELSFGRGVVTIPSSHRLGVIERPSMLRLEFATDPNRHVVLRELEAVEPSLFLKEINQRLAASKNRDLFVFVPGYNVDFESSTLRLAEMSFDLAIGSPAVLFSWPSQGTATGYLLDQESVSYAVPHFASFLKQLASLPNLRHAHILAQGLGCRLAVDSILSLTAQQPRVTLARNLILVSPDVDRDAFAARSSTLRQVVDRITVYVSSNDNALRAAKTIHGSPRAGDAADGVKVFSGTDTVDVSAKDSSLLGLGLNSLFTDIYSLITQDAPPEKRIGLRPVSAGGRRYWIFN